MFSFWTIRSTKISRKKRINKWHNYIHWWKEEALLRKGIFFYSISRWIENFLIHFSITSFSKEYLPPSVSEPSLSFHLIIPFCYFYPGKQMNNPIIYILANVNDGDTKRWFYITNRDQVQNLLRPLYMLTSKIRGIKSLAKRTIYSVSHLFSEDICPSLPPTALSSQEIYPFIAIQTHFFL